MPKVKDIADGMIVWKGDITVGIKGINLPEIFEDCDCVKLTGDAFDYSLSPSNEYTEEQLAFIDKVGAKLGGSVKEIDHEHEYGIKYSEDEDVPLTDLLSQSIPADELPF